MTYTIEVTDGHGGMGTEKLSITVTGSNDAPVITAEHNPDPVSALPGEGSHTLGPVTGSLTVSDADIGDTLTGAVIGSAVARLNGGKSLPAGVNVAALIAASAITFEAAASDGGSKALHWTYNPDGVDLGFLGQGDTLTITYLAEVNDGHGNVGCQPITVTITGVNDPASIGDPTISSVTEDKHVHDNGLLVATGTIPVSDPDHDQSVFQTSVTAHPGDLGSLSINADGSYCYTVDNHAVQYLGEGDTKLDVFTVTSVDGTSKDVSFVVNGVNDAPVIDTHHAAVSYTADLSAKTIDAGLTVHDVDSANLTGATVAITGHYHAGQDYLLFTDQGFGDGGHIHGAFDATTGILALTGNASVADYQTALQSVEYMNSEHRVSGDERTVSFAVADGSSVDGSSNVGTVDISVTPTPVANPDNLIVSSHAFGSVDRHGDLGFTFADNLLLKNDDGGSLLHIRDFVSGPSHGSLDDDFGFTTYELDSGNALPAPGGTLSDSFSYRNADSLGTSDPAKVLLSVVNSSALTGTAGDDIIIGANNAPERIEGGAGNDILVGGLSAQIKNGDTFVFAPGSGHDGIVDFQHGIDKIELDYFNLTSGDTDSDWFSHWADAGGIVHQGPDTLLVLDPGDPAHRDTVLLKNVTHVSANDFIIHPGSGHSA